jgi:hypothetical protein
MNRPRTWLLLLLAVLAAAVVALGTFTGGASYFGSQRYEAELTLPTRNKPVAEPTPTPVVEKPKPCNGQPGPVKYYANVAQAAKHNSFGVSLDPDIDPFEEFKNVKPDLHTVVTNALESYCHDPVRARAVTAAAFPKWDGLHQSPDWVKSRDTWISALDKLHTLSWDKATTEFHSEPPEPWTMMMTHGATSTTAPKTYLVNSNTAGWYLRVPINDSSSLLLRIGCGGQPTFDLREGTPQTSLRGFFPASDCRPAAQFSWVTPIKNAPQVVP